MKSIKVGDTFNAAIRIYDEFAKLPVVIDESITFASYVKDSIGNIIAVVEVQLYDQIESAGWISLYVPSSVTALWPVGHAYMDVRTIIDSKTIVTSDTIEFIIEPSLTPIIGQGVGL